MGACRGSGAAGGGYDVATFVSTQDGSTADLSSAPLRYGKPDPALSGAARRAVEAQERKRLSARIEFAQGFDADGLRTAPEKKGGKNGVRTGSRHWPDGGVFTHNHPRSGSDSGILGGTFSVGTGWRDGDISTFIVNPVRTIRASAAEGTYSMSKGPGFDGRGLLRYAIGIERDAHNAYRQKEKAAYERHKKGETTRAQYIAEAHKHFNEMLVSLHNGFIAGQSQFGYTYTLERRA